MRSCCVSTDHQKQCPVTSKADPNCPRKVKCPVWITGTLQDGTTLKPKSLNTRNWDLPRNAHSRWKPARKRRNQKSPLPTRSKVFRPSKRRSRSTPNERTSSPRIGFRSSLNSDRFLILEDVKLPDLAAFREAWTGASTTQRRDQEILKSFFWYCDHSDFLTKNPVIHLDPISVTRPKTEPFTDEQQVAIFNALANFPDEYGRRAELPSRLKRRRSSFCSGTPAWRSVTLQN